MEGRKAVKESERARGWGGRRCARARARGRAPRPRGVAETLDAPRSLTRHRSRPLFGNVWRETPTKRDGSSSLSSELYANFVRARARTQRRGETTCCTLPPKTRRRRHRAIAGGNDLSMDRLVMRHGNFITLSFTLLLRNNSPLETH